MTAQLSLWDRDETRLLPDLPVMLSVRESPRARQLIIQALPPRTVEVVVPRGVKADIVTGFINEHRAWIERAGEELVALFPAQDLKPDTIELHAIAQAISVQYEKTDARARFRFHPDRKLLTLYARAGDSAACSSLLRRWLLKHAATVLKPWIAETAADVGFSPKSVQVRLQKTRWGSCSARGAISLNAALLLVAPELVRYLFVHELCHLRHLSHSRRYWQMVAGIEPDYRRLDRQLAASWQQLPGWLFAPS